MSLGARAVAALAMDVGARLLAPEAFRDRCPSCGCAVHPLRAQAARASPAGQKPAKEVVIDVPRGGYEVR